jgi:hypothetical protein
VNYVPAGPTPWTLTAFRDITRHPNAVEAVIETTQPGTATLEISDEGRVVARATQSVVAGHSTLRAAGHLRNDWYDAKIVLNGANGVNASDEVPIHGARALTVPLARNLLGSSQGKVGRSAYWLGRDCRRYGRRRVDCQVVFKDPVRPRQDRALGFASLKLRRSGVIIRHEYESARFRRHPRFDTFSGVQRLSRGNGGKWSSFNSPR